MIYLFCLFFGPLCLFAAYLVITSIRNAKTMGALTFRFPGKPEKKQYRIEKENHIDIQTGFRCSGFASAFVLRHFGIDVNGDEVYDKMPCKTEDGCVYPKGIVQLMKMYGLECVFCRGNLNSLKNELCKGVPVIVFIRLHHGKDMLHFVPVVGYDEEYIYFAESWEDRVNCDMPQYNRRVPVKEFMSLWAIGDWGMPLYSNTYFAVSGEAKK